MVRPRWLKSKRFWTVVVLCMVAIAIIGPAIWIAIPHPGINHQNFRKIQVGMTVDEVTALMGRPPGNYARPTSFILAGQGESMGDTAPGSQAWMSDSGCIIVGLDENDCVTGAGFSCVRDDSLLGRLHKFLGY
jgi:hypothetical protein